MEPSYIDAIFSNYTTRERVGSNAFVYHNATLKIQAGPHPPGKLVHKASIVKEGEEVVLRLYPTYDRRGSDPPSISDQLEFFTEEYRFAPKTEIVMEPITKKRKRNNLYLVVSRVSSNHPTLVSAPDEATAKRLNPGNAVLPEFIEVELIGKKSKRPTGVVLARFTAVCDC